MAFDISRLTSAVNKYLNSISDIGQQAAKASQEIADKAQFQADLGEAIKANMAGKMRDVDTIPDIGAMVQNEVKSATAGIDSTFQQINGAFLEISEAGRNSSSAKESVAASSGAGKSGTDPASTGSAGTGAAGTNKDAYAGRLSPEALKELSNSGYFSGNMIASSLFKTDDENESTSGSTSAFDTKSLDALNMNSLIANSLGVDTTTSESLTSALKSIAESNNTDATTQETSNDLAKALIKAYTSSAQNSASTSIFGDFIL